jgi:hypothetical protein
MPRRAFMPPARCGSCGQTPPLGETLHYRERLWWCATCLAKETPGKDNTTKVAFYSVAAQFDRQVATRCKAGSDFGNAREYEQISHWQADAANLLKDSGDNRARVSRIALGEVVPEEPQFLKDTLSMPDLIAMDASLERTRLLTADGLDALALALDAANSANAKSSIEKMHLHQLAVLHKNALEQFKCASYTTDAELRLKVFQTANRLVRNFQHGLMALARLRGGGMPIIQHVHVSEGGQAVIGGYSLAKRNYNLRPG